MSTPAGPPSSRWFEADPLWFKRAIFYEIHLRGFFDGNADGSGDLPRSHREARLPRVARHRLHLAAADVRLAAARRRLRHRRLLRTCTRTTGRSMTSRTFLDAAHERGIRVIADLVMNHTSSDHPWFRTCALVARRQPGARLVRLVGHPGALRGRAHHLHRHRDRPTGRGTSRRAPTTGIASSPTSPTSTTTNPQVQEAMLDVLRFWLDLGLDGFRLDAVPYLYEREGTNCENLPETHAFLRRVRETVDAEYRDRVLLAEANQWPEDVVAYFGDGDECHMAFHFPVMPRMFMAVRREEAAPIYEILERTPDIPDDVPVGAVPAQPRRADARDGHRRRARLHVLRVREGSADEAQPRDPPPAGPAARQRPRRDGAAARRAVLAAGQPGPLLRRRDRDGRQRLPRRPRRRAHADAVDRRSQRRLLARRLRAALRAAADGSASTATRR